MSTKDKYQQKRMRVRSYDKGYYQINSSGRPFMFILKSGSLEFNKFQPAYESSANN